MDLCSQYAAPMQNESHNRVEELFHAARERSAGPEREAYLDGACGEDAEVRLRVEALLIAHDEASNFLEVPAVASTREQPGCSIGVYKLLQEIGEGGMGVVYMAEQEKPVRRKVALKVIKLGMDTKQVIARFEAERQALAMMDHANIARVLDAGSTEAGRPYFVMELVRGVPIDEYCDNQKLPTTERLSLFIEVCRAVQQAHQKGIIHRDLKPTNVLVTSHDGKPIPKIIDFGVAKATNQKLTERTLFTEFHQIIGTPEYMSPEQAEMSGTDVDTRSDIYSLGVLLYQLLTGTTPVDAKDLRTAGYSEMTRIIREDDAQAPSTRISTLGADIDKIAIKRSSDASSLSRQVRGDLDWIVMKALEKDRTRRYETASAFAEDISRHLEDRPVEAGPPGAMYRITKFTRRNRKAVTAALVLALVVGLGLAGTTAGFLRARSEAERSSNIGGSLQEVLAITHSANNGEELEAVLATVRELFGETHATYAAVLDTLAVRLHDAGDFETAAELGNDSIAVWKEIYGESHPNVAAALARLGSSLQAQGADEEAERAFRDALSILSRTSGTTGLTHYNARVGLADLLANRGEYAKADELLGEALVILNESPATSRFRTLETLERRIQVQLAQPDLDAIESLQAIYNVVRELYPDESPLLAITALGYGRHLAQQGDKEAGIVYLREAITRLRLMPNPPSVYVTGTCDTLFQLLRSSTDPEIVAEADNLLRDIITYGAEFLGTDSLAANLKYYAKRLHDRELLAEALEAMLEGHQVLVDADYSVDGRESLRDGLTMLAGEISIQSDQDPALYARANEAVDRALLEEPDHPAMLAVKGIVLYRLGEYQAALKALEFEKPLSKVRGGLARAISPADHAFRALAHEQLGNHESALAELEELRAKFGRKKLSDGQTAILQEVESTVEPSSSSKEED